MGSQAHSIVWPPLHATHAHMSNHVVVSSRVAALCALSCIIFMCGCVRFNHQVNNTCPVDENAHIFVFSGVWTPSLAAIFVNDTRRVHTRDLTFASLMRTITSHVQCGQRLRCRSAVPTTSLHFCITCIWASVSTNNISRTACGGDRCAKACPVEVELWSVGRLVRDTRSMLPFSIPRVSTLPFP